ncbi:MAG: cadherin-like beta sandwich domain-containing protein, partial [Verrucomicrobiota bacterium]
NGPYGVAVDGAGNVYVADQTNHRIRKVTPAGVVTTLAGSGAATFSDGTGIAASFRYPQGVAVDGEGNVYVADALNSRIRKITSDGVVTTLAGGSAGFADGTGAAASLSYPSGIALDASTNLYVSDYGNNAIRKITPAGLVSTLAGGTQGSADGTGAAAQFDQPQGIAVDAATNVYVYSKNRIRKVTPAGVVTTLAGSGTVSSIDGTGAAASFNGGYGGLTVDAAGSLYVCDIMSVRKVTSAGVVTTIAGSGVNGGHVDGDGSVARFGTLRGLALDSNNNLFLADGGTFQSIRRVTIPTITSVVLAVTGLTGLNPLPVSLAVSNLQPQTTYYYSTFATNVAGSGTGSYLSFSTPATNALLNNLTLSAGTPSPVFASNTVSYTTIVSNEVTSLTATATLAQTNAVLKVNGTTVTSGVASSAINLIVGTNVLSVAVTAQDGVTTNLYTVSVWRYPLPPAATTLVASGITSTGATINGSVNPGGAADAYFRYGTTSNEVATVSTLAGGDTWGSADGTGTNALFRYLRGVAVD